MLVACSQRGIDCSSRPAQQRRTCTQQAWMAERTAAWISSTSSAAQERHGEGRAPSTLGVAQLMWQRLQHR